MATKKVEFIVGIFVLLGAAALLFLALRAGNLSTFSFQPTYSVVAKFDNIGSLKERAPVKSSGVVVGRVKDISFDNEQFKAVVTMDMESKYKFSAESTASIKTAGLLGEQFIDLIEGPSDETVLENNSEIMFANSALSLEDLISKIGFSGVEQAGTAPASTGGSSDAPKDDSEQENNGFKAPGIDTK